MTIDEEIIYTITGRQFAVNEANTDVELKEIVGSSGEVEVAYFDPGAARALARKLAAAADAAEGGLVQ
jgi:hypothetical protein